MMALSTSVNRRRTLTSFYSLLSKDGWNKRRYLKVPPQKFTKLLNSAIMSKQVSQIIAADFNQERKVRAS